MDYKKGIIINNKIKYYFILLNITNFVEFVQNKNIRISLEKLIAIHRSLNKFKIITLIDEAFQDIEKNKKTYYFFIYKDSEIITSCRLIVNTTNEAYINMVHTNINYRKQNFCKKNIIKLIKLTKNIIKQYVLHVDENNISAIKCYKSVGFNISKINKKLKEFEMIL